MEHVITWRDCLIMFLITASPGIIGMIGVITIIITENIKNKKSDKRWKEQCQRFSDQSPN
jgi:hypothetical protein